MVCWCSTHGLRPCASGKFGSEPGLPHKALEERFELKPAVVQFIEYVRGVEEGEILRLEVRSGIPVSMETLHKPDLH